MKTNAQYHADTTMLSSSVLKLILKSPAEYKRQYIDGERDTTEKAHFLEGSYTHALVLEPEVVQRDFAFYTGGIKRGAEWKNFWEANQGKTILSAPQKVRAEQFASTLNRRPEALRMLQSGLPEHTMTSNFMGVDVKMRADYINIEEGYIVDVKTTNMPSGSDVFRETCRVFDYDLSAALYCQIAHNVTGKLFDFYWVVISKQDMVCDIYKASTETLSHGASKVIQAIYLYKKCKESGLWIKEHKNNFNSADYEIEII